MDGWWEDRSVLEAASWRLASELARRHPKTVRVARTHPGGGQYDCLTLVDMDQGPGTIQLNRNGTIQVHQRFDGRDPVWPATEWDEYLRADPREFLHRLEVAAGLPRPSSVPPSTPRTLTLRVLAAIAATAVKSVDPIEITSGMIDTSGYGGGVNEADFEPFTMIPDDLFVPQMYDLNDEVGYRFWFVRRNGGPDLGVRPTSRIRMDDSSRRDLRAHGPLRGVETEPAGHHPAAAPQGRPDLGRRVHSAL